MINVLIDWRVLDGRLGRTRVITLGELFERHEILELEWFSCLLERRSALLLGVTEILTHIFTNVSHVTIQLIFLFPARIEERFLDDDFSIFLQIYEEIIALCADGRHRALVVSSAACLLSAAEAGELATARR